MPTPEPQFIEPNRAAPRGNLAWLEKILANRTRAIVIGLCLVGFIYYRWQNPPAGPEKYSAASSVYGPQATPPIKPMPRNPPRDDAGAEPNPPPPARDYRKSDEEWRRRNEQEIENDRQANAAPTQSPAEQRAQARRDFESKAYLSTSVVTWQKENTSSNTPATPAPLNSAAPQLAHTSSESSSKFDAVPACQSGTQYWLPEGTILEAILDSQIQGEMAGPVDAHISTDVYAPGTRILLLPQGTKLLGRADRVSGFGQRRLAITFHRLMVFPPLSVQAQPCSIELAKEESGLNQEGATGLSGKVNNHMITLLAGAAAVGIIQGASVATYNQSGGYGAQVGILNGLSQGTAETTARILDRYTNRLPTITVPPGTRIKVQFTKDRQVPSYPAKED